MYTLNTAAVWCSRIADIWSMYTSTIRMALVFLITYLIDFHILIACLIWGLDVWFIRKLVGWLIYKLVGWSINWLIVWLVGYVLIDWCGIWLITWLVGMLFVWTFGCLVVPGMTKSVQLSITALLSRISMETRHPVGTISGPTSSVWANIN